METPPLAHHPVLVCIAGPDAGKRCRPSATPISIGRDSRCGLLSDDPEVAAVHGTLYLQDQQVHFRSEGGAAFLDGHAVAEGVLLPGQQLRMGRSVWELAGGHVPQEVGFRAWEQFNASVGSITGVGPLKGFSLKAMFAETFKRRTPEELEAYFTAGTPATTPSLAQIDSSWPRPWAFFRVAGLAVLCYIALVFLLRQYGDIKSLIPAIMFVGSFAIPCSLLVFYYEMNVPRNVSAYEIVRLFLTGTVLSAALSCVLYSRYHPTLGTWGSALGVAVVEETAKAACLLLVVRRLKYRWTLNGLLFGATIGTGFAVFESAGYALSLYVTGKRLGLLRQLGIQRVNGLSLAALPPHYASAVLLQVVQLRGLLSLCGMHALWTGLVGAALWRVRGDKPFTFDMLTDSRFWRVFALAVALHMLWDSPLPPAHYIKYLALGLVGWTATLGFVQDGLNQIRRAKQMAGDAGTAPADVGGPSASEPMPTA